MHHACKDTRTTLPSPKFCPANAELTPQELNEVAAELCEHITLFGVPHANKPSAVVACVPTAMKVRIFLPPPPPLRNARLAYLT